MNLTHFSDQRVLEILGDRIKAARLNRNITADEVASKAGINVKTVYNLENGKKSTGLLSLIAILRAMDMLDELNTFIPEPPPRAAAVIKEAKMLGRTRKRASRVDKDKTDTGSTPWTWEE